MPDQGRRSPGRILAPLALVVFALAFAGVVLSSGPNSGGEGSKGDTATGAGRTSTTARERTTTTRRPRQRASYTVKVGDTLGSIAEETGVPVERILELNPDLDPQALVSGQKIKLRE